MKKHKNIGRIYNSIRKFNSFYKNIFPSAFYLDYDLPLFKKNIAILSESE